MDKLEEIIQLINTDGIGPVTFYKLMEKYGSVNEAVKNLPPKFSLFPINKAKQEVELAKAKNVRIITYKDKEYPENLKELADAPPVLYTKGNVELLNHSLAISIVGARNASINGRKTISKIAYDLTNSDILIISGMARGIDTSAHKGAMHAKEQRGPTIAVLGTGVDVVYPSENKAIYEQIAEQGLIISEFPLGTEPQVANFPRRNRIVSALSIGTLVGEASINSGSLITARFALEQNKDVFAIPGNPNDSRSSGPNKLIKDGAILVEDVDDIINTISITNKKQIKPLKTHRQENLFVNSLDKYEKNVNIREIEDSEKSKSNSIIEHITVDGIDKDELIRLLDLDPATVAMELLDLELSGKIEKRVGNKVALTINRAKR